ncbi:MAG TPA: hypothetical protein VD710_11100, partial [Nitrososphaeraceae archaeon]|nr:hypothetical protein [Nitrososphaeraceae archaeon]
KIVDLDNLRVHVDKFLKANSSINAVVITNAYVTEINGVPEAKNGIWVIYNPYAKQILPVGFSIPNEINSAEESLISSKYLDLE